MPRSGDLLSPVGPKKVGQSAPDALAGWVPAASELGDVGLSAQAMAWTRHNNTLQPKIQRISFSLCSARQTNRYYT
jgi:hypothetical protein